MDDREYLNWQRYYKVEPFGFPMRDQRHSELMASLWALLGGKKTPKKQKTARFWRHKVRKPMDHNKVAEQIRGMFTKVKRVKRH